MSTNSFIVPMDVLFFTVGIPPAEPSASRARASRGRRSSPTLTAPRKWWPENPSSRTVKCGDPVLGMDVLEFVIRPTGKGKVKVKIITTLLQNEPAVANYEFEVK